MNGAKHGSPQKRTSGNVLFMKLPSVSLPSPPPTDIVGRLVDYLVDTPDGSVGVLDGIERDAQGRPAALIVVQGWFGRRRLRIPIGQLAGIDHARKRILLAPGAAPIEHKGPVMRLIDLGDLERQVGNQEEALDDVGWRTERRGPALSEILEEEGPSASSLCRACGRTTRTTSRGACAECWQRKLPGGEGVFRPIPQRTASVPGPARDVPTRVVVAAIATIVVGLLIGLAVML